MIFTNCAIPDLKDALNPLKEVEALLELLNLTQAMFPALCIFPGKHLPHIGSAMMDP